MFLNNLIYESSWRNEISSEFEMLYFKKLNDFLIQEQKHFQIYPPNNKIFSSFNLTPFNKIKVVIIGQDPYHNGYADGLCFSTFYKNKTPASLRNIFKEIKNDIGTINDSGSLEKWSKQGVFLLNSTLTVRKKKAGSHQNKGWEKFTDNCIKKISEKKEKIIFLLWGKYAQKKERIIDKKKHFVLKSSHPSPLSSHLGFFGCKHFSKTNEILKSIDKKTILW
ncbi:MAG: uracil-DNA glycosylase [Flavobacteriales bacterium]|nr:uracil-DNA glycosylase [Flavobacteriales bacterium]|tara:strand:- start:450 stop:1115 length:666 start_codon:yes stop_codon:yes gene_type:complete